MEPPARRRAGQEWRGGAAVVSLALGVVSMALAAGRQHTRGHVAEQRAQRAAFEALTGSTVPHGHTVRSADAGYRAAAQALAAARGVSAFVGEDGRVKHYLPASEAPAARGALSTQGLAEDDAVDLDGGAKVQVERDGDGVPVLEPGGIVEVDFKPPDNVDFRIPVEVYLESQGRASKMFTQWVLVQVVGAPGMTSIINLLMFPWGKCSVINKDIKRPVDVDVAYLDNYTATNVTLKSGWPAFLCEHGPSECEGNAIMSCVSALYPDLTQWFRVNACIMARTCADGEAPLADSVAHTGAAATSVCQGEPVDVAPRCIKDFGGNMDLAEIAKCVQGKQGTELLLQNMVQTQTLVPPIQTLPWILVDQEVLNYPNRSHVFLLGKAICDAYIRRVQPFINGSVPRPLGCYYFPSEPPYMAPISLWDEHGILVLWAVGGVCFLLGTCLLVGWKYFALKHSQPYTELHGGDDADA